MGRDRLHFATTCNNVGSWKRRPGQLLVWLIVCSFSCSLPGALVPARRLVDLIGKVFDLSGVRFSFYDRSKHRPARSKRKNLE